MATVVRMSADKAREKGNNLIDHLNNHSYYLLIYFSRHTSIKIPFLIELQHLLIQI